MFNGNARSPMLQVVAQFCATNVIMDQLQPSLQQRQQQQRQLQGQSQVENFISFQVVYIMQKATNRFKLFVFFLYTNPRCYFLKFFSLH